MAYEIEFYETPEGKCPTDSFLDEMPEKHAAKIERFLELLEEKGPDLPRPYADTVRNKIREFRVAIEHHNYRLLYFFFGKAIVITHGFLKKSDAVPETQVQKAQGYMDEYLTRHKQ